MVLFVLGGVIIAALVATMAVRQFRVAVPAGHWVLKERAGRQQLLGPGDHWLNPYADNAVTLDQSTWTAGVSLWFRRFRTLPIHVVARIPIAHRSLTANQARDLGSAILRRCADAVRPVIESQSYGANLLAHDRLLFLVRSALADLPGVEPGDDTTLEIYGDGGEKWGRVPPRNFG